MIAKVPFNPAEHIQRISNFASVSEQDTGYRMKILDYRYIIWDWNGTLLDDVTPDLLTVNQMMKNRNLGALTLHEYRNLFCFPIADFYRKINFPDDINSIAREYHDIYSAYKQYERLHPFAEDVLNSIQKKNIMQFILSATKEDSLRKEVEKHGISSKFKAICGCEVTGEKKENRGKEMVRYYQIEPEKTLMIGDTFHDAEIARALGFDCILFSGGHNDLSQLNDAKINIFDNMQNLLAISRY
ncbi:MAG: HAD family hydrolase [Bacteroidales bacterium]|nr:HAD family hydrolase [Bacteroidales bacterium]